MKFWLFSVRAEEARVSFQPAMVYGMSVAFVEGTWFPSTAA